MFLERDKLFKIIEKFLSREIDMRDFLCAYEDFYSEILKLREKFCSELDELKDLQLLNIGTLELKINSNSSYFYSLVNLLDQKYGKLENAEFIFIGKFDIHVDCENQFKFCFRFGKFFCFSPIIIIFLIGGIDH